MSVKDEKLDQIIKTVEANDIKFLKLQLSDIHGLPKSMAVPLKKADDIEDIVNDGLLFDGSSVAGLASINDSDLLAKPDINTFSTIPWRPESKGTSRFICDIFTTEGKPYDGDPRGVLKKALEKAEKRTPDQSLLRQTAKDSMISRRSSARWNRSTNGHRQKAGTSARTARTGRGLTVFITWREEARHDNRREDGAVHRGHQERACLHGQTAEGSP